MTIAVCISCGSKKFGAWVPCKQCSYAPVTGWELGVSTICSDHHLPTVHLDALGNSIREYRERGKAREWNFDPNALEYLTDFHVDPSWRDLITLSRAAKSRFLRKQMNWHFTGTDGYQVEIVTRGRDTNKRTFDESQIESREDAFFISSYENGVRQTQQVSKHRWYYINDINICIARQVGDQTLEEATLNSYALAFIIDFAKQRDGIDLSRCL